MSTPLYQVDAFTDRPFAGNPAAVAMLDAPADASWMQAVAAEMNLAETAFLVPDRARGRYALRWFTPAVEVALCGHATLAAAHALWTEGIDDQDALAFDTMSGELRARRLGDGWIELDFPANVATEAAIDAEVIDALGVTPVRTAATRDGWCVVEVATPAEVADAAPDLVRLAAHDAVILTAAGGDGGADITSRVFAPGAGIPEDPVTGSAHCVLATWWWDRVGKAAIDAHQASARGGRLVVVLDGERVRLRGRAVTTLVGRLAV